MPSAAPDGALVERFRGDLSRVHDDGGSRGRLGIALSGGPDSTALLLLAAAALPERIEALTVDHGLRDEATVESASAGALCASLGVPHEVARLSPVAREGNLQAKLRELRYIELGNWAERRRLGAVLTAHHADDQAETVLMRLARGSGLAGLSAIRGTQRVGPVLVLRPLLGWRKAELEAICAAAGVVPARDPSNSDDRFDRTAARDLLARTSWLDPPRLAAAAAHLAEAEAALAAIADERYAIVEDGDGASLRPDPLREIARRHLRRLLAERFDAHPDGPSLERAVRRLSAGGATTCADVLCRADGAVWRFRRAPSRRGR